MYFRVKRTGTYGYLQIVESFREQGHVRQHVLSTIGRLDILQASGQFQALMCSGLRFCEKLAVIDAHAAGQIVAGQVQQAGPDLVLGRSTAPERQSTKGFLTIPEQTWAAVGCSLNLSPRELQIVKGVFLDKTDIAIAADLGISFHTVHTHFERLHHKLAVHDRPQIILRVIQEFLVLRVLPQRRISHARTIVNASVGRDLPAG